MRPDLHCFVCCCSAFLPSRKANPAIDGDRSNGTSTPSASSSNDYYIRLGVHKSATHEEIRKAYKRCAIESHPDKMAQRAGGGSGGKEEINREEFQKVKEAYETLSDPHKRSIYDAVGPEALPYLTDPTSIDSTTVAENLTNASCWSKTKVLAGILFLFSLLILPPVLICLKVDSVGIIARSTWGWVAFPVWVLNFIALLLLSIQSYRLAKLATSSEDEDDTGHSATFLREAIQFGVFSVLKFGCILAFEILLVLKLDGTVNNPYRIIFIPIYVHEILRLISATLGVCQSGSNIGRMVTISYLEKEVLDKPYQDLTQEEKEELNRDFIIVHTTTPSTPDVEQGANAAYDLEYEIASSPEFQKAMKSRKRGLWDLVRVVFHTVLLGLLIPKLDNENMAGWSWWLVFLPLWIGLFCICCGNCVSIFFTEGPSTQVILVPAQENDPAEEELVTPLSKLPSDGEIIAAENGAAPSNHKPPILSASNKEDNPSLLSAEECIPFSGKQYADQQQPDSNNANTTEDDPNLRDGLHKNDSFSSKSTGVLYEEFEVPGEESPESMEATAQAVGNLCSLLCYAIIACLFVGKLQGGSYSSFWIIFPILLPVGILLCCTSCAIYCTPDINALKQAQMGGASQPAYNNDDASSNLHEAEMQYQPPLTIVSERPSQGLLLEETETPEVVVHDPTLTDID